MEGLILNWAAVLSGAYKDRDSGLALLTHIFFLSLGLWAPSYPNNKKYREESRLDTQAPPLKAKYEKTKRKGWRSHSKAFPNS